MKKILLVCLLSLAVWASESNVYKVSYNSSVDKVLENMLAKFKEEKLVVVWQLDILEEFKTKGLDKNSVKTSTQQAFLQLEHLLHVTVNSVTILSMLMLT